MTAIKGYTKRNAVPSIQHLIPQMQRNIVFWLPNYRTAIDHPESPSSYLRDVLNHNVEDARRAWAKPRLPDGRMLRNVRAEYRACVATAIAVRRMLADVVTMSQEAK